MKKNQKKGQAAIEYLITHGWALLAVVVVIAAIIFSGVFNSKNYVAEKCVVTSGIFCADSNLKTTEIRLVFYNSLGKNLIIENITVGNCTTQTNADFDNGRRATFILACNNQPGSMKENLKVSYLDKQSNVNRDVIGILQGRVK